MNKSAVLISILLFFIAPSAPHAEEGGVAKHNFLVIINPHNAVDSLDRQFLVDVYFKRVTRWPNDGVIRPVDQASDSPVRQEFSARVLRRSVHGMKNYWQQLIFSGRDVPPPELVSDKEVIQYVLKNPGAIGYVSRLSRTGGVKTIEIK